jgi:hypothetical protein
VTVPSAIAFATFAFIAASFASSFARASDAAVYGAFRPR